MARLAGLDIGDKRIGVAVSDPLGFTAQVLGVVERRSQVKDIAAILELLEPFEGVEAFVAGLPLLLSGEEGVQADHVRHFCGKVEASTQLPVYFQDERLTTRESERLLIEAGLRRKKRKTVIDQTAAALILQTYLEAHGV